MTGDHRHSTDLVDVTFIAEFPSDADHFSAVVEVDTAKEEFADSIADRFWLDECRECGAALQFIEHREPSEVLD